MEYTALYNRPNDVHRRVVKQLREEYSHQFRWRSDGKDSLLDIGCRAGDITVNYILPWLPSNFSRIVGVDLSDDMLHYAQENFQRSKVAFEKLDIGELLIRTDLYERFDHITSFFCLHFVQNQEQAMKNIYNLLLPGGDCLLAFLPESPFYETFNWLSLTRKWSPYMADVQRYKFPYRYSETQADDFKAHLKNAGFKEYQVTLHNKQHIFDGKLALKSELAILKHVNKISKPKSLSCRFFWIDYAIFGANVTRLAR